MPELTGIDVGPEGPDISGLKVGVVYGPMSEEDRVYMTQAPRAEWSLTALVEALESRGAQPEHLDPTEASFTTRVAAVDVALLNCHGPYGEDGRLQGLLDFLGVPYTSCGVLGSAVGMDKMVSKAVFTVLGIATPPAVALTPIEATDDAAIGYPAMLKAVDGGSSVGIAFVHRPSDVARERAALERRGFDRLFLERFVPGRAITVSVLGTAQGLRALPALECVFDAPFYDEDAKLGGSGSSEVEYRWPGDLPPTTLHTMSEQALAVHAFLRCRGAIRVDFMVDADAKPWALEVNTIPGLQRKSNLPKAAELAGISYEELVAHVVAEAASRRDAVRPPWLVDRQVVVRG